jgi:hypothetical protein
MSENSEIALSKYERRVFDQFYGICSDCNKPKTDWYWCQNCNSKRFQQNFNKWTSGNKFIDKFIQSAQLKARTSWEVMEWIPYNHLRNIKYLAQGGFSIIYKAIWLDGEVDYWNNEEQQWTRHFYTLEGEEYENAKQESFKLPLNENERYGIHVVLKSLNDSSNINDDFLNEVNNL